MPLWNIYHTESAFQDEDSRKALSKAITDMYVNNVGLPPFYVVVVFEPFPKGKLYVGGDHPKKPFVRITIAHIAKVTEEKDYPKLTSGLDKVLEPHIAAKGYDWEYHIDHTPLKLWKVNGVYAPEFGSSEMELWKLHNRVIHPEELTIKSTS
ncbi:hypothetical protein K491DRAFT_672819 [Lophiostoma macrostomum CBS 122681]|uniref:Tautomerase cis-CaaD-like domain-containing protein n=1 Tax=Lophiostoma macrostomum CBS 122681 TaxID=1314788 RepID=A0A6A6TUK0_9PLEO|nr:hypothetical protein K491DRAFT_672819 [Lophiostoma macrostomum CBS 122681]